MVISTADAAGIAEAGGIIRSGGLVAFPTETVYGLGANALDADAVAKIFAAKGRPATNPLIVHVRSADAAAEIARVSDIAKRLIDAFWPGPLTLVLPKESAIPDIVTAGGPTVAVRQPSHPVAQALLDAAGVPISAPSANRSESISPTRAEHVLAGLGDAAGLILDGGPCTVGIESTVLDVTVDPPRILRPGMVTPAQIADVLGYEIVSGSERSMGVARSPGQMPRHYAPRTPVRIHGDIWAEADGASNRIAVIAYSRPTARRACRVYLLADNPTEYAAKLYDTLHAADAAGVDEILIEAVPDGEPWSAIRDRLTRAAAVSPAL